MKKENVIVSLRLMKISFLKYWMRIAVFVALFFGAIQPNYAHILEGVGLEKSVENWAVGTNKVKAWEAISDLPVGIRTNTTILSKGDELMTLGFSKTQFRTLATLDDANALDIAKRLRSNHNLDFDKITNIVDNSHILGGEFITSIDNISKGPGKLLNPNGLNSKLDEAVNTSNPNEGIKLTADDGGKRINNGSDIHIENGKADLEDLTLGESVQHKLVNGSGSTATRDNLASATNQLRGSGGEVPSQPTTIAHVRIDNAAQAEANLSRTDMLDMLRLWHQGNNVNYTNISKVVIENTTGKHVFDVVSEITN